MADKTVSVELKAKDSLSPAFAKCGQAAAAAGRQIDAASQTAAQSMGRLEQAISKAEQASSGLGISATKVGATLGTAISGGLLLAVRAAADAEVSQKRLQTPSNRLASCLRNTRVKSTRSITKHFPSHLTTRRLKMLCLG